MIGRSLWEAMNTKQPDLEAVKVEISNLQGTFSYSLYLFLFLVFKSKLQSIMDIKHSFYQYDVWKSKEQQTGKLIGFS